MPSHVLVTGPPLVLEAVRQALPEMDVGAAPASLDASTVPQADCLIVGTEFATSAEAWRDLASKIPVVAVLLELPERASALAAAEVPCVHLDNPAALRLAMRTAALEHRVRRVLAELTGTWAHDARGAIGVVRLALELLKDKGDQAGGPVQKVENGVLRLGFLLERLPSQLALALDLPLLERGAPSLFPNLDSYVKHLQLVHSRRPLELSGGDWNLSDASQALVPYAAGFAELAFSLSPARGSVRFSTDRERELEVACECPNRPPPWDVDGSVDAAMLSHRLATVAPYRLIETSRLALRSGIPWSVEFTPGAFVARVRLGEPGRAR